MFSPQIKTQKIAAKIAIMAALPLALLSQNAIAAPYDSAPSITVAYQDLNLANKHGQKRLATRINSAVKKVCSVNQARNLNERIAARKCQDEAKEKAYRQMGQVVAQYKTQMKLANNRIFIVGN